MTTDPRVLYEPPPGSAGGRTDGGPAREPSGLGQLERMVATVFVRRHHWARARGRLLGEAAAAALARRRGPHHHTHH